MSVTRTLGKRERSPESPCKRSATAINPTPNVPLQCLSLLEAEEP
jgi:hypothetical protein